MRALTERPGGSVDHGLRNIIVFSFEETQGRTVTPKDQRGKGMTERERKQRHDKKKAARVRKR